jgi:hypothetical protein
LFLTDLQKRKWKGEERNENGEMKWSKLIIGRKGINGVLEKLPNY